MNNKLLFLIFLSFAMACTKSGTEDAQNAAMVADMMDDPSGDSDSNTDTEDELPVLMGEFMDGAHPTSGTVTVNSERTTLMIENFKSDDGPILELYVANDVQASEYTSLGVLQGLEGDFTYDLPDAIDFNTQNYVLVWCVEFSVSFGHALLE